MQGGGGGEYVNEVNPTTQQTYFRGNRFSSLIHIIFTLYINKRRRASHEEIFQSMYYVKGYNLISTRWEQQRPRPQTMENWVGKKKKKIR